MKSARAFFDQLNQDYLELHRREGDLYWSTHTGQSDEHDALGAAGLARKTLLADPQRLTQIRAHLARLEAATQSAERDALLTGLRGWVAVFECNALGNERAAALLAELIRLDADLFARRQAYAMHHVGALGRSEQASSGALRANARTMLCMDSNAGCWKMAFSRS
jgi:hypothetical protein